MNQFVDTFGFFPLLYILAIFILNILALSLFLALIYQNYLKAFDYGEKYRVILAFDQLLSAYDTQRSCDIVFGDQSDYIKYKLLGFYNPNTTIPAKNEAKAVMQEIQRYGSKEDVKKQRQTIDRLEREHQFKHKVSRFVRAFEITQKELVLPTS